MTLTEFLREIWNVAAATAGYLLAYRGALVVAVSGGALARWLAPSGPSCGSRQTFWRVLSAGIAMPSAKADLAAIIWAARLHPEAAPALLIGTHVFTPYHLILLGPLLGKDALGSVVLGGVIAAALATVVARWLPLSVAMTLRPREDAPQPITATRALSLEFIRNGPAIAYGLLAGGAIAAWGLSSWAVTPATLVNGRMAAQLLNGLIGVMLALLLNPSPAATPFIGTYLWKVGLAHAGLVAFFCAAPVTPVRLLRLHRDLGKQAAITLALLVAGAAVAAGFSTALVYRLAGLTIRYKLVPEQLL